MEATATGAWPWFGPAGRAAWTMQRGAGHHHHRRRPGPPWLGPGFGWPFPGGPGGPGGRGRQRRGDVRLAVLTLLAEQPMHGYQIISELTERSQGAWRPSPGSVYPTLQQLEDEGLVTVAELDGRRTYTLTDAGRQEVERAGQGRRPPWERTGDDDDASGQLRRRAGELMAAVMQVAAAGTPGQAERAERVLVDARRSLYRLLAEDDEDEGEGEEATS